MIHVAQADLQGKIRRFGTVEFVRAEWWGESPRFVLLRYTVHDHEEARGVRLDIDKQAIIDDVEGDAINNQIKSHAREIWQAVVEARRGVRAA